MKTSIILSLLAFSANGYTYIMMDGETLNDNEVATLIYVLGCGDWENFIFSVSGNQIEASVQVPEDWFNCHVDPLPPQFWNRIPLVQFPAGNYELNITLSGPKQSGTTQLFFSVRGAVEPQPVPMIHFYGLLFLISMLLFAARIKKS